MHIKKRFILIPILVLSIGVLIFCVVNANGTPRIFLNGTELITEISPELKNDTMMGPVRTIAEAFGANVNWNEKNNIVEITTKDSITKDQVSQWITTQGKEKEYFLEGLSHEMINLDADNDLEVIAKIDGTVHLGNFFLFDKTKDEDYKLIGEKAWKIENSKMNSPFIINGKKIFEIVERTGGTGLDVYIAHLWYLEEDKMVEAWQGQIKELNAMKMGNYSLNIGSYQILNDTNILYYWESKYKLGADAATTLGEPVTTVKKFTFDGNVFK